MNKIIFELQLFASGISGGPTAGSNSLNLNTTSGLSVEMKEYYDTELLENVRANLVFNQFGKNQGIPKGNGKEVEWRRFASYGKALDPLTEGVTPAGQTISVSSVKAEVKQYGDYTAVSDMLDLTAIDDTILACTDEHSAQASATLDTLTRDVLMGGTNVYYAPIVSGGSVTPVTTRYKLTSNALMTSEVVNHAATILKKHNTPKINGKYIGIIHPSVVEDLRNSDGWLDAHQYAAPGEIFNGEIGELHGVRFVETTEAKVIKEQFTVQANATTATTIYIDQKINGGAAATSLSIPCHIGENANTITAIGAWDGTNSKTALTVTSCSASKGDIITLDNAVYATLFLGQGAYGVVDLDGMGLEMIIKALGSGGTSDPLNQRQTVGWKAGHAAAILDQLRLLRVESFSGYSAVDEGN